MSELIKLKENLKIAMLLSAVKQPNSSLVVKKTKLNEKKSPLFVTAGIWATGRSTCRWRTALMSGSGHQTATLAPTTTAPGPTFPSTTTLRWLAGSVAPR